MGEMAEIARRHWRRWLPQAYAAIRNETEFFQAIEDEAAAQIDELTDEFSGPGRPDESFLERAGRYRMARSQAEEIVFQEVLTPPPEMDAQL